MTNAVISATDSAPDAKFKAWVLMFLKHVCFIHAGADGGAMVMTVTFLFDEPTFTTFMLEKSKFVSCVEGALRRRMERTLELGLDMFCCSCGREFRVVIGDAM